MHRDPPPLACIAGTESPRSPHGALRVPLALGKGGERGMRPQDSVPPTPSPNAPGKQGCATCLFTQHLAHSSACPLLLNE